ncbi:MAG: leucine-rich repeat domain-containing protein [Coriobacteriales bacterium]|nr:leucine-rich repeat domain-containing protein [Coriobacteriales bacterium]
MNIVDNILINVDCQELDDGILIVPDGVIEIEADAPFKKPNTLINSHFLKKVVLPASLKKIGTNVFRHLALESINLENVEVIEERAFQDCDKLVALDLSSAKVIGRQAFADSDKLEKVTLNKDCEYFKGSFPEDCEIIEI